MIQWAILTLYLKKDTNVIWRYESEASHDSQFSSFYGVY
jgi:hypothetical protein